MEDKDFTFSENGINPVHSTQGSDKDIYFSNGLPEEEEAPSASPARSSVPSKVKKIRKQSGIAGTYLFFIVVIVLSMICSVYAVLCMNDILGITKTKSTVTVFFDETIEEPSDAIDLLSDNGLITCKNFCKLFADLLTNLDVFANKFDIGGPYEAGVYYLYGKMGLEGMLQTLQGETATSETVSLTFPEGYTVADVVDKLVENDVCDKSSLLSVISSTRFTYSLVSNLESSESVPYRLEGYLFPDTYEFYIGESASSVVKKFISNGDTKITEEYRKRAEEMGYSMYEILTIASIIQKEAGSEEQMKEISSVIHNRLSDQTNFPSLGCQSTTDYINNSVGPSLSSTSAHTADYYLTYYNTSSSSTVVGLPAGPICNPGLTAIEAALYPDDTDYYYFFHDTNGVLYTAKTYSEFKTKISAYAPYLNY